MVGTCKARTRLLDSEPNLYIVYLLSTAKSSEESDEQLAPIATRISARRSRDRHGHSVGVPDLDSAPGQSSAYTTLPSTPISHQLLGTEGEADLTIHPINFLHAHRMSASQTSPEHAHTGNISSAGSGPFRQELCKSTRIAACQAMMADVPFKAFRIATQALPTTTGANPIKSAVSQYCVREP